MSGPDDAAEPGSADRPQSYSDAAVAAPDFAVRARLQFPVVGIGASAGGLDPLCKFFAEMPAASGMCFVVIQHLPPQRESMMAEILSRHTQMPVTQIEDGQHVEPNRVYVIRPGYTVTLEQGVLHLGMPVEGKGHRRPVDDFFRSLAAEQKEKSVAVILSGMGTNGTAGAQAIKAVGGLCLAQDPQGAEFPGMPQSLIYSGYADQVLEPADMAAVLTQYIKHPYLDSVQSQVEQAEIALLRERQHLNEILAILRTRSNHDFTGYKKPTVLRRIQRRLGLLSLHTLAEYAEFLRDNGGEVAALANDMMINVTGFFRDSDAWEALRHAVVRPMVEDRDQDETIRAWVTACASGEEAYTLAMLLMEEADRAGKRFKIKIFATDTADKSLALARAGVYPGGIEGDIGVERLERFFDKGEHTYSVKKDIRDMVVFAPQDVLRDPPFSKVDICTCRNLLIYLEHEVQRRVLSLLHFSLCAGGHLFLGNAETPGTVDKLFDTISKKWRIYRRAGPPQHKLADVSGLSPRSAAALRTPEGEPLPLTSLPVMTRASVVPAVQEALLERFVPPTVIVDRLDRIVYFHANTAPYLMPPVGEPTHHLFEVLRVPLRSVVRQVLRRAATEHAEVAMIVGAVETPEGMRELRITAAPLIGTRFSDHFYISFLPLAAGEDAGAVVSAPGAVRLEVPPQSTPEIALELEDELRLMRRELQEAVEAFESSNEELKASGEEVISINEELQSANEELETSKEELQSLNEELITVNGQLQTKIAEVEATTNDLSNLLMSTNIAVLFLDTQFRVRRFTPAVNDLLELIEADIGRPITDLAPKYAGADLVADARAVLASLVPLESEMRSHSGIWYQRRTLPYRTADHRIAGIVVTFVNITARKVAEQSLAASQERLQAVIEQMPAAVLVVEAPSGKLLLGNRRLAKLFGQPFPLPSLGEDWIDGAATLLGYRGDGAPYHSNEWPLARTLASSETINDEEIAFRRVDGTTGVLLVSSTPISNRGGKIIGAVASFWDITVRKAATEALRKSEELSRLLINSATDYAIFTLDITGHVTSWNSGAQRLLGWTDQEALGLAGAMIFTPEDRAERRDEEEMHLAIREGRALDERVHLRKDGSRFWASGILTRLMDDHGKLRGFAKIMRDTSERHEAEARLQAALLEAEAVRANVESVNTAKDEFISTMSHELRTPLNTIRLWSRMLGSGRVPRDEWDEGIQTIDRAARAQQQLIDDLLDVSRMSRGQLRLSMRPMRLTDAVKAAVHAMEPLARSRRITIKQTLDPAAGVVRADPDRIQQVIWNLLGNAVKFTPAAGRIEVRLQRHDTHVDIAITDSGIGIGKEFLPHVFDRFRQAEGTTTRRQGGLGLGLAIAKQLAELHGGEIIAQSAGEGHGATFTVRLPLREVVDDLGDDEEMPPRVSPMQDLSALRVLLVEDDEATRYATKKLLEMHGASVESAASAASARDVYSANPPALLLCDIGLPGENGFTLMEQIRAMESDQSLPRVPAIALTAFARPEDRQRAFDVGFDEHVPKPVNIDLLTGAIQRLVRTSGGDGNAIQS